MLRIGTLSLNINAPDFNYGAMLHSWAFQQYLLKKAGVSAEIIDYTMPKVEGWNRYDPGKSSINFTGHRKINGTMEDYLSRARKFDDFISNHLKVSKEKYVQKTISRATLPYDVIICESDVIWSAKRGKLDPVFYLATPSMRGKRRIAYAPSMADAIFTQEQESQLDFLLDNVHFISCRESFQKPLLEKHTDKPVQHVVDPVMLLDAKDYDSITAPRIMEENYLLLYLPVDENEVLRQSAIEYAGKNNLKILEISTMLKSDSSDLEVCVPDAGIEEFLSAIKYADMVFTNSFHAICFSIIFGRQFYAFTRKFNGKVLDICQLFGLEDYYMADDVFVEKPLFDVEQVQKRFQQLQEEGRNWLENALVAEIPEDNPNYDADAIERLFDNTNNAYQMLLKSKNGCKKYSKRIIRKTKKSGKTINKKTKNKVKRTINAIGRNCFDAVWNTRNRSVSKHTGIQNNKIVVMSITDSYNCNSKYICEEIIKRQLPYEITWLVDKTTDISAFPKEIKTVYKNSVEAMEEVYSAKLWLDNGVCFSERFEKKPEQFHIQTMHGSLGIKRLDNSILARNKTRRGRNIIRRESANTDYVLTNSQFEEDVFHSVFWKNVPMLRYGHARTDVLFETDEQKRAAIRKVLLERYNIPLNKKIVLYAPTHRRGLTIEDLSIDYLDFVNALKKKYGDEYVVLLRIHKKTKDILLNNIEWTKELSEVLFDVTDYPDIQELMLVTDIGVTDYSSWIYDFVNTRRPGYIFATDLERYNNVTGLYYPLEETPFPVCKSHKELVENVLNFDNDDYLQKVEDFLTEKQAVDDGHSAERAVDLIVKLMKDK